jgi:hypothetical protein
MFGNNVLRRVFGRKRGGGGMDNGKPFITRSFTICALENMYVIDPVSDVGISKFLVTVI